MTLTTLALNGVPIEDLGLSVVSASGIHDLPARTFTAVQPALGYGQRYLAIGTTVDPRQVTFRLNLPATSNTNRQTLVSSLLATFNGLVELSSADAPTLVAYGLVKSVAVASLGKLFVNTPVVGDLVFVSPDALWYDRDPQILNVPAATTMPLPIANASVRRLSITVQGTTTNPIVVIVRDQTGAEIQRMTLTSPSGNLGASNWAVIDCDRFTITKSDGTDLFQAGWLGATESWFLLTPTPSPTTNYSIECAQTALNVAYIRSYLG